MTTDRLPGAGARAATAARAELVARFAALAGALGVAVRPTPDVAALGALVAELAREAGPAPTPVVLAPGLDAERPALRAELTRLGLPIALPDPTDPAAAFADPLAGVGVSAAALGIAETGSLVVADGPADRLVRMLAHTHVVVLAEDGIVPGLDEAGAWLGDRVAAPGGAGSYVSFITGPSRSADIEMTLAVGAHGPARVVVALLPAS